MQKSNMKITIHSVNALWLCFNSASSFSLFFFFLTFSLSHPLFLYFSLSVLFHCFAVPLRGERKDTRRGSVRIRGACGEDPADPRPVGERRERRRPAGPGRAGGSGELRGLLLPRLAPHTVHAHTQPGNPHLLKGKTHHMYRLCSWTGVLSVSVHHRHASAHLQIHTHTHIRRYTQTCTHRRTQTLYTFARSHIVLHMNTDLPQPSEK